MNFKDITLEISLKPFKQTDDEYIGKVCENIFRQWYPLIKDRDTVSVMLWCSDGSEILDYSGELDREFEWACYIGTANLPLASKDDLPETSLHIKKHFYINDPPKMTYGILKKIVLKIKETGKRFIPKSRILVGETFDIGPEFAISDFKYNRHREVCSGNSGSCNGFGFVDSTALLNADSRRYAAYPNGIPQDTPFGTFLGKQTKAFFDDMGFDYIWLSNGLGFSANPWESTGKIFDGKEFHPEKLDVTRNKVFAFWKLFSEACPDIQIRTRGTNNSVGIDYASDGVPLYDIYKAGFDLTPPPNSPWAALNNNYGLEIMGHMTRIAELPCDDFMFRYYIHDPWWINTPWYDRYDSSPTDIYLPMSIGRVDENGVTRSAGMFNILSIDNSFGDMPDSCVNEPLAHILKAEKDAPDDIAPFLWVYPVREFTTAGDADTLHEMYFGDRFICDAINSGFPLNCVVSSDNFRKLQQEKYRQSVIVVPIALYGDVKDYCENGGRAIIYGSEKPKELSRNAEFVKITDKPSALLDAARAFGYDISGTNLPNTKKPPMLTVHRSDNAFFFSCYNSNTANETLMRFPLGAPILKTGETEIANGYAKYHFSRGEHRECRFFVKQNGGVISCREEACVNMHFRRRIILSGLEDATVCYFPEAYCREKAYVQKMERSVGLDDTPIADITWERVADPENGVYFKREHLSGDYSFLMPRKNS